MKINTITDLCTGCRTCEQLCPKHCITMEPDHEGFLTAYIDEEKCIKCGLCRKRCPQNIDNLQNAIPQKTYAVRLKDEPTLYKSASGGAFAGLAICVIENGGIVYGARYDENLRVFHSKAKTIEEVIPQLSSKYVQSDTEHTYTEVKEQLAAGRLVLYSGTGCQIAGLKSFLKKDYPNLILVDLVCHGVPSPLLFAKYIELLEKKHGAKIKEFDFRDKKNGWGYGIKYKYKYKYKYGRSEYSPYFKYFMDGVIYRECCYKCKYANTQRCGDITIADYWGINKCHPEFFSTKGVSLVLINTSKGQKFFENSFRKFHYIESRLEYAVENNENLKKPTTRKNHIRNTIYCGINDMKVEKYFKEKFPLNIPTKQKIKLLIPTRVKLILKKILNRN